MSCKYSHAYQSYSNFEFSVSAILNFSNGDYYKIRWYVQTLGIIWYTVDHQYTHCHANIHMYNTVIDILSFQWWTFWKFKMAVTTAARSRLYISYMIVTLKNFQYSTFHVFMTIWTIMVFDVSYPPCYLFTIIVRWNELLVRIAHNYTASFLSILGVLSPFSFWEFINKT